MLKFRDEYCDECCEENRYENRFERGFEISSMASTVYSSVCLHAERQCCVRVLGNQLSVDKWNFKRMRVQIAHTSVVLNTANTPLTRTTLLMCGKPRTIAIDAAKGKTSRTVAIGLEAGMHVGAKRECLPKLGVRLKHDRIDDDAEYDRKEGVLRDCLLPQ